VARTGTVDLEDIMEDALKSLAVKRYASTTRTNLNSILKHLTGRSRSWSKEPNASLAEMRKLATR
jgi:hypothetical protein